MTSEKKKICIQLKTRIQWQEMCFQLYYALLLHSASALTEPTKHFMRNKPPFAFAYTVKPAWKGHLFITNHNL